MNSRTSRLQLRATSPVIDGVGSGMRKQNKATKFKFMGFQIRWRSCSYWSQPENRIALISMIHGHCQITLLPFILVLFSSFFFWFWTSSRYSGKKMKYFYFYFALIVVYFMGTSWYRSFTILFTSVWLLLLIHSLVLNMRL